MTATTTAPLPTAQAKHPTETAAYWRDLARNERALAKMERGTRGIPVESFVIRERNAKLYDAAADAIESRERTAQHVADQPARLAAAGLAAPVSQPDDLFDEHALACEIRGDVPWPLPWKNPVARLDGIAVEFDARDGRILRAAVDDGFLFLANHGRPCRDDRAERIAREQFGPSVFEASGRPEFMASAREWRDAEGV